MVLIFKYTLVSAKGANAEIRPGFARTTPTAYCNFCMADNGYGLVGRGMGIGGTYQTWAAAPRHRRPLAREPQVTIAVAFMRFAHKKDKAQPEMVDNDLIAIQ